MDREVNEMISDRAGRRQVSALRGAVRLAVRRRTGLIVTGVALGIASSASAAPFPPIFPLQSLLPDSGGDGSSGFVLSFDVETAASNVSAAGDVNGDGIDDMIVGTFDLNRAFVVFGRNDGFPAELSLSDLLPRNGGDGSRGFVLISTSEDDTGFSVSAAGDVNGDGIDDLIVGSPGATPRGRQAAGRASVVFGRNTAQSGDFPATLALEKLLPAGGGDGSAGFVLSGMSDLDEAGWSVSAAGDVNEDGVDDLIIGTYDFFIDHANSHGQAYVVFGRDTAQVGDFPAELPLSLLLPSRGGDGSLGFVVYAVPEDHLGSIAVSKAGDLNADGIDDVIIGVADADANRSEDAGQSYVIFGRNTAQQGDFPATFAMTSLLPRAGGDGSAGFALNGIAVHDFSGVAVSGAGDLNNDGIDDVVVGAEFAGIGDREEAGQCYVVYGRDTAQAGNFPPVLQLASLLPPAGGDGSTGFVLNGIQTEEYAGFAVSDAGDVNGDGIDDLIVGARQAHPGGAEDAGSSYVVFGRDMASPFPAVFPFASLHPGSNGDGSAGFVLTGFVSLAESGFSVSSAGDVNGDGVGDLIIGTRSTGIGSARIGSYVVFGRTP